MYFFYIMERVSGFIVIEEESDQLITTYLTTLDKQSSCKKNNSKPKYKQTRPSIGRKETYCRGPQSLTILHHERLLNLSCNWASTEANGSLGITPAKENWFDNCQKTTLFLVM